MKKLKIEKNEIGIVFHTFEDNQPLTENELELYKSVKELMQSAEYDTARKLILDKIANDVKSFTSAERVLFAFMVLFDEQFE